MDQTVVTNTSLQKQLLSEYEQNSKNKSQEYSKFVQDKKSLCTILYGQYDEATQTEITLGDNYTEDRDEGRLLAFIERLRASGDNGGLSYSPYKKVVAIKSDIFCKVADFVLVYSDGTSITQFLGSLVT